MEHLLRKNNYIYHINKKVMALRYVLMVWIVWGFVVAGYGQNTFQPKAINQEYKGIIYRHEKSVDIRLHTNGFALAYNTGKIDAFNETSYYHFELGYVRDFRERRQTLITLSSFQTNSSTYIYGKQNNIINIRAGKGWKRYLSEKARRKGIALGYCYEVGPSLALLKPYYIDISVVEEVNGELQLGRQEIKYSQENRDQFLNENIALGSAGYFRGFNEITVVPGIQAKGGLLFSLGAYDKMVKAVEVGAMLDVYIQQIPIMVETEAVSNKPYFFNLYLSLQLGRRSN